MYNVRLPAASDSSFERGRVGASCSGRGEGRLGGLRGSLTILLQVALLASFLFFSFSRWTCFFLRFLVCIYSIYQKLSVYVALDVE